MKKLVISTSVDQPSAKPETRMPFFAKKLDQETLRSVRAGDGLHAQELQNKGNQGG